MNKTLRNLALVALAAAPFAAFADTAGSGTAADPYKIATAEDLQNMHNLVKADETTYFVQTADIDMAGMGKYIAPVGSTGQAYNFPLNYDGQNHVIKNFSPTNDAWGGDDCYAQSVFGVFSGELKNLGIVDINISASAGRAGAISGYLGQSEAKVPVTKVSNVYVTGTVKGGSSNYTGGLFGTTGTEVELNNCFVNVNFTGAAGGKNGGFAGRINHKATINNCYVAGTVDAGSYLVSDGTATGTITTNGFVVFNTGSENVAPAAIPGVTMANTAATKEDGVKLVKSWAAYSATEEIDGYPALNYALSGAGTAENPYVIASAEDLCNAYRFVDCNASQCYYFIQTADIDMEGVEDYHALNGYNGIYKATINYDGQNHIIKNFTPNMEPDPENVAGTDYYYCTSIFGVLSGVVKNLGVVDAYCATTQGAGILAAYGGYSTTATSIVENVFVTGEIIGESITNKATKTSGYTGGMFGTTSTGLAISNSFANVAVSGPVFVGAVVGRLRNYVEMENVYAAGTVAGSDKAADVALIATTDKADGSAKVSPLNVIAFNTGSNVALSAKLANEGEAVVVATDATKAELIATVQGWEAFSADKLVNGYPALAAFDYGETAGIFDIAVDEVEANGPAVYYNLQGVQVANPENGVYIVRRGNKVTKELIRK